MEHNVLKVLVLVGLIVAGAWAQFIPIDSVRMNRPDGVPVDSGQVVSVSGIVTLGGQLGSRGPAHIQDNTGGLALYGDGAAALQLGDSVTVTGTVGFYRGLTELTGFTATPVASGISVAPLVLTLDQLDDTLNNRELHEGRLVMVRDVFFETTGVFIERTYRIHDATGTSQCRVDSSTDIDGNPIPEGGCNLIAVVSQYDFSNPYWHYYQLVPRFWADFSLAVAETPVEAGRRIRLPASIVVRSREVNLGQPGMPYRVLDFTGRSLLQGRTRADGVAMLQVLTPGVYLLRSECGARVKLVVPLTPR